jgi:hypothetical protein
VVPGIEGRALAARKRRKIRGDAEQPKLLENIA